MLQNGNCAKVFADVLHLFMYFPSKYKLVATHRLVCVGHALVMGVFPLFLLWIRDFPTPHTDSPPLPAGLCNPGLSRAPDAFADG